VLCARPDNEDPGQPSFASIKKAAEAAGLKAAQVPISGTLTDAIVEKAKQRSQISRARYSATAAPVPAPET